LALSPEQHLPKGTSGKGKSKKMNDRVELGRGKKLRTGTTAKPRAARREEGHCAKEQRPHGSQGNVGRGLRHSRGNRTKQNAKKE